MKSFARDKISQSLLILMFLAVISATTSFAATYTFQQGAAAIVSGATDSGSHCDDCVTAITLPFGYKLYGTTYTTANVGANGNLQFGGSDTYAGSNPLPDTFHFSTPTILALQNDLRTDQVGGGIFTSVTGASPNRIFNIEWRAVLFSNPALSVNFEIRLFEGLNRFEIIYGAIAVNGAQQTVGVQKDNTDFTQFENNTANTLFAGLQLIATAAPTAASVSIGGRILNTDGNAIARAAVIITNIQGETRRTITNPFGYYRFDDVQVGETYILSVRSKRYQFAPRVVSVTNELNDLDFTAEP